MIWSSVTRTLWMRGSVLTFAAVLIPRLQNSSEMNPQEAANPVQLVSIETMAADQPERLKPELAGLVFPLYVNEIGRASCRERV